MAQRNLFLFVILTFAFLWPVLGRRALVMTLYSGDSCTSISGAQPLPLYENQCIEEGGFFIRDNQTASINFNSFMPGFRLNNLASITWCTDSSCKSGNKLDGFFPGCQSVLMVVNYMGGYHSLYAYSESGPQDDSY